MEPVNQHNSTAPRHDLIKLWLVFTLWSMLIAAISFAGSFFIYYYAEYRITPAELWNYNSPYLVKRWQDDNFKATALLATTPMIPWLLAFQSLRAKPFFRTYSFGVLIFALLMAFGVAHITMRLSEGYFDQTLRLYIQESSNEFRSHVTIYRRPDSWYDVSNTKALPALAIVPIYLLALWPCTARLQSREEVLARISLITVLCSTTLALIFAVLWIFEYDLDAFLGGTDPGRLYTSGLFLSIHLMLTALGTLCMLPILARRRLNTLNSVCYKCGYDLTGIKERCPECGTEITQQTS